MIRIQNRVYIQNIAVQKGPSSQQQTELHIPYTCLTAHTHKRVELSQCRIQRQAISTNTASCITTPNTNLFSQFIQQGYFSCLLLLQFNFLLSSALFFFQQHLRTSFQSRLCCFESVFDSLSLLLQFNLGRSTRFRFGGAALCLILLNLSFFGSIFRLLYGWY